jgi:signal peptidase I
MFSGMMGVMESTSRPFQIKPEKRASHFWLQLLISVVGAIGLAALLNVFVFQSYYVDGESMSPTLHSNDRLIISKAERSWSLLRVVGLPGDKLTFTNGTVTLYNAEHPHGTELNALLGVSLAPTFTDNPRSIVVPDNMVFVMGDNRAEGGSYDSRAFGPVPTDDIVGRLLVRILPLNHERVF